MSSSYNQLSAPSTYGAFLIRLLTYSGRILGSSLVLPDSTRFECRTLSRGTKALVRLVLLHAQYRSRLVELILFASLPVCLARRLSFAQVYFRCWKVVWHLSWHNR